MFSTIVCCFVLLSCGNDDDNKDEPTEIETGEWYVTPGGFAAASDFQEIITAIDNHELLSDYGRYGKHYAEIDEFFHDNGMYSDSDAGFGRLRFWIDQNPVNIIHIVDDMTAEFYIGWLYKDCGKYNSDGEQRIWNFNAGRYFDKMAYYIDSPSILIYTKNNDTLVFSNGDVYIKKPTGLQSSWGLWTKFTPMY